MPQREISPTTLNAFNKCHYLGFLGDARVRPVHRSLRMTLGTLIHIGMAAALAGKDFNQVIRSQIVTTDAMLAKDAPGDTFVVEPDVDTQQLVEDAVAITARAFSYLFSVGEWETVVVDGVPLIETKLVAPIGRNTFVGVVDWVAREKHTNTIWVLDHKSRVNIQPDEMEDYSVQLAVYQRLLWEFDIHTVGSITYQIRSAVPAIPKQNKDGSMSRADIATDWETYRDCLLEAGLDPLGYVDMQSRLEQKVFFKLTKVYRSNELIESIWKSAVVDTVRELNKAYREYEKGKTPPRNMHSVNCRLCSSREWCQAELRGMDTSYLLESGQFVEVDK